MSFPEGRLNSLSAHEIISQTVSSLSSGELTEQAEDGAVEVCMELLGEMANEGQGRSVYLNALGYHDLNDKRFHDQRLVLHGATITGFQRGFGEQSSSWQIMTGNFAVPVNMIRRVAAPVLTSAATA